MCAHSSGPLARLEEEASESQKHNRHAHSSVMMVASTALGTLAQSQKKQVKRRHRRKRDSCTTLDRLESNGKQEPTDRSERSLSSDRSQQGEKRERERSSRSRRELPPRLRCSGAHQSASSSEEEAWREARSWSKEKARRGGRRSGSSRERHGPTGSKAEEDKTEVMELQSVGSDEGKEKQPLVEDSGGLKKRHSSRAWMARDTPSGESSQRRDKEKNDKSRSLDGSSSLAEDGEEVITETYQEKGSGRGDMSVPIPQKHCGVIGGAPPPFSDDSELEVCRSVCVCECTRVRVANVSGSPSTYGKERFLWQSCKRSPEMFPAPACVCAVCSFAVRM